MSEHLFIICREINQNAQTLHAVAREDFTSVTIIIDKHESGNLPDDVIFVPDEALGGFEWITSENLSHRALTAWSRGLFHAMESVQPGEYVWFVEDDVAFQARTLRQLLLVSHEISADFSTFGIESKQESHHWYWWDRIPHRHTKPMKSFNPLCRCSYEHLMALKDYMMQHGRLGFHEISFASVAKDAGLHLLDWSKNSRSAQCFGEYHYRPMIQELQYGICHPVKDAVLHERISMLPDLPLGESNISSYFTKLEDEVTFGSWAIDRMEYRWLSRWCEQESIKKVIEFGPGVSSFAFVGAGCVLHSFESDEEWMEKHIREMGRRACISFLPSDRLPESHELPFTPDVVMVDGPPFREGDQYSRRKECAWAMSVCGRFLLHDSKRSGEKATLADYQESYYHILHIPSKKGMALVTDLRRHKMPEFFHENRQRIARYSGLKQWGWYISQFAQWQFWLATEMPVRVLEVGAFDGVSSNMMKECLFRHADSIIDCIDPYEPDPTTPQVCIETKKQFLDNRKAGDNECKICLHEASSLQVLSSMVNQKDNRDLYDFIFIDGSHFAPNVLTDAVLCWPLLKRGGILIFNDYGMKESKVGYPPPSLAIDAFLQVFGKYVEIFERGWMLGLIKIV